MSLHALAGHMAAKGRGPDSMLVHMTPDEVQSLQTMARAQGGEVTINPETGLPEAGFLSDTLKALAPVALGAVLGPAGFGLSAGMAAAATGGITALATGSLSRGLMAGMGAYGGAGLAEGLMGSGIGAAQSASAAMTADQIAQQAAAQGLTEQGVLNQAAANATKEYVAQGMGDRMMQGASAAFNDPKSFVQGMGGMGKLAQTGLAAISPMMAAEGVQTTTPKQDTGTIRNFSFDPYSQTYASTGNYPASEYKGMAQGGIVALAAGGVSDAEIQGWMAANQGADDKTIAAAMQQYGVTPGQLSSAMGYNPAEVSQRYAAATGFSSDPAKSAAANWAAANNVDINQQIANFARANPNASDALIDQQMQQYGISNEDVARALGTSGGSKAMEYNVLAGNQGLSGLNQNINSWLAANPKATREEAEAAMRGVDLNEADVLRATGKSLAELFAPKPIQNAPFTMLPGGVSGGGNTVVNPNGTITTTPNIPGRPEGGFTGMGQLRDIYTQGGGSLGYVNPAPKNMEEFNQRFGQQTGDSKAAYDYLIGKGAYPTKSGIGEIMRPYSEATLGIPAEEGRPNQKYLYDPATKTYKENPNYRSVSYNTKGERIVGLTPTEVLTGLAPFKDASDDAGMFDFVTQNNISEAQLAAALGISLAEARARLAAAKKAKGITDTVAQDMSGYGGDSGDAASVGGDSSGVGGDGGAAPGAGQGTAAGVGDTIATGGLVPRRMALGGLGALARGGMAQQYNLGGYSDGGRLLRGPGDGVSDSIPATIGNKQPARLADGEFVVPARIVSELGNGSTEAGARKLYAMMDRVQKARGKTTGKSRVAANTRADKYLPA